MAHQPQTPPIDTVRDLHCVLARGTTVLHASPGILRLTGHQLHAFVGFPLFHLVHSDDRDTFLDELTLAAASPGRVFRFYSRIRTAFANPLYAAFELHGHYHQMHPTIAALGNFILVARPAFLSSSMQMDRFLELKMEELALLRHLDGLRHDKDDPSYDADADAADLPATAPNTSSVAPPDAAVALMSGFAVSAQNAVLGQATSSAATENQHSRSSHALVHGDAGIPYAPSKLLGKHSQKAGHERRRSQESKIGRVCTWCGTTEAPEWRHGPSGPKTLCNACGLRHAKSRRKLISTALESDVASTHESVNDARSDFSVQCNSPPG